MKDNQQTLEQNILRGLDGLGLSHDAGKITSLLSFLELLNKWNSSFNLSGVSDIESMVSLHLLDSLALSPYLDGNYIIDVGTGAGLPGIPLAIMHPDKHFVLLDSNGKKTRFLFQVKVALELSNISIENCRIEHYQNKQQIDMVMCRAFSSLAEMLEKTQHLIRPNTKLLAMKGRYPEAELADIPTSFRVSAIVKLDIPDNPSERHLIELVRS